MGPLLIYRNINSLSMNLLINNILKCMTFALSLTIIETTMIGRTLKFLSLRVMPTSIPNLFS